MVVIQSCFRILKLWNYVQSAENGHHNRESHHCSSASSWVGAVTVCRNSDLAASGAGNGSVRLWAVESETKDIKPLYDVPLVSKRTIKESSYLFPK